MALLYRAELHPGKLDLLAAWLPARSWYSGPADPDLTRVAACRFDDPAGAVGIETIIVDPGDGSLVHTPLTYRDAPLDGRERWLLGTAEHSVLGRRWVYDACGDPVYARALAGTILTGGAQAPEFVETDGRPEPRSPAMSVTGSGNPDATVPTITTLVTVEDTDPAVIVTDSLTLTVARVLGTASPSPATNAGHHSTLTGAWSGQPTPVLLAHARDGRRR